MFSAFFHDPDINQGFLKNKMKKFIDRLGESFPEWASEGLCSGYVFMLIRAELSGESPKFFSRLKNLSSATDDEITQMTTLIKEFNAKQNQLINATFSELKNEIKPSEDELKRIQKSITELENEEKSSAKNHSNNLNKLKDAKAILIKKIADKRKIFFENIEKRIKDTYEENQKELLEMGQELYYFIHSLLAAFNPGKSFDLRNDKGTVVQQGNIYEILSLLPNENVSSKNIDEKTPVTNTIPIRHAFSFQFGYSEQELAYVLGKTLLENDLVRLNSTDHAIYLKKQNDKYILYDPNSKTGAKECLSIEEVAKKIIDCFYEKKDITTHNLIGMEIFEKNSESPPVRPTVKILLRDLLKRRGEDKIKNSVNVLGYKSNTILLMAARAGNDELMQELIEWSADPRIKNEEGFNSISLAAIRGYAASVEVMTNAIIASQGDMALQQIGCVETEETKKIPIVVRAENKTPDSSEDQEKEAQSPLTLAAKKGHLNIVKFLIDKKADVNLENENGFTPVTAAIQSDHVVVLQKILDSKGSVDQPNKDTKTPLYFAITGNQVDCIKVLVQHHADLDKPVYQSISAAIFAANEGYDSVIETLAELKADLNQADSNLTSPLHQAAQKGHLDVVKLLIALKVNLDPVNKSGYSPLMVAASYGNVSIVKQLAETKAIDLYKEDSKNMTALLLAAQKGHIQVVNELINIRANIDKPNKKGITPICMAVKFFQAAIVERLIESKANVNCKTKFGASPISLAIEENSSEMVEILAESKANLNIKLKNGMTPLQFAMSTIKSDIVSILAKHDANFDLIATNPNDAVKFLFIIKSAEYITQNPPLLKKLQAFSQELTTATIQYIEAMTEKTDQLEALNQLKTQKNALSAVLQESGVLDKIIFHFEKPSEAVVTASVSVKGRI